MIHIFNTTICPTIGLTYRTQRLSRKVARTLIETRGTERVQSAIGHKATADLATEILGIKVPVNRIDARVSPGDTIIALKLRGRLPEGQILDAAAMKAIGVDLVLIEVSR